jgi:integrase
VVTSREDDMASAKITKRRLDSLRASERSDVFLWDTELRGFGVRLKPSGAKSFVISYYAPEVPGKRERLTIGSYGSVAVDEARKEASALLGRVAKGENPAQQRNERLRIARDETVARHFEEYIEEVTRAGRRKTIEAVVGMWTRYVEPAIGQLPVQSVTDQDVRRLHRQLRDKPIAANRTVQLIRTFYNWLPKSLRGANPASDLRLYPERPRRRYLSDDEARALEAALKKAEKIGLAPAPEHIEQRLKYERSKKGTPTRRVERNTGMFRAKVAPADPVAVAALRFLMLSGWREQEALSLRWDAVDLATGCVSLESTKTGASDRVLGSPALALLAMQPRVAGCPYVFPGRDPSRPREGIRRLWASVRHEAELKDMRLHDLRHSVASFAVARGYSLEQIGALLGHRSARSTARYAHLSTSVQRRIADDVGASIVAATEQKPRLKVLRSGA